MAIIPDREIEESPLGGRITRDGCTVRVPIYRFAGTDDEWTPEAVDHQDGATVWDEAFAADQEAYAAFERAVAEDGIRSFAEVPSKH